MKSSLSAASIATFLFATFFAVNSAARLIAQDLDPTKRTSSGFDLTGLMETTGIRPIPIRPDADTKAAIDRRLHAWLTKKGIEPAKLALKDSPGGSEIATFVDKAWPLCGAAQSRSEAAAAAREGKIIESKFGRSPLLSYVQAILAAESPQAALASQQLLSAAAAIDAADAPSILGINALRQVYRLAPSAQAQFDSNLYLRLIRKALKEDAFEGEEAEFAVIEFGLEAADVVPSKFAELVAIVEAADLAAWAKLTILGVFDIHAAWRERGGDVALKVTPEGWAGFEKYLKRARQRLTKAWSMKPERPYAAARMIVVVMGQGPTKDEPLQLWHDRAVQACVDWPNSCNAMQRALMQRWHGSIAHQLAFGIACMDTRRYDTELPRQFVVAVDGIAADLPKQRTLYHEPEIARRMVEFCQSQADHPSNAWRIQEVEAELGLYAWACGDYQEARNAFAYRRSMRTPPSKIGPPTPTTLRLAQKFETRLEAAVFESLIMSSPQKDAYLAAHALRSGGKYSDAAKAFKELVQLEPKAAAFYLTHLARIAEFQEQLRTGEWRSVPLAGSMAPWIPLDGRADVIFANDARTCLGIRAQETDHRTRILLDCQMPKEFEMRGKAKLGRGQSLPSGFGVLFERNPPGVGATRRSAWTVEVRATGMTTGSAVLVNIGKVFARSAPFDLEALHDFLFRFSEGRVTFVWNGAPVLESVPLPSGYTLEASPYMGFGWNAQSPSTFTEITDIELRMPAGH